MLVSVTVLHQTPLLALDLRCACVVGTARIHLSMTSRQHGTSSTDSARVGTVARTPLLSAPSLHIHLSSQPAVLRQQPMAAS